MQTVFGVLLILHLVFLLLVPPTSALRPREQAPNFKAKAGMFLIHFATMSPSALAVQLESSNYPAHLTHSCFSLL